MEFEAKLQLKDNKTKIHPFTQFKQIYLKDRKDTHIELMVERPKKTVEEEAFKNSTIT